MSGIGLTQNISETLISLCRASCFKSGNHKGALASLRLCGSLRQAASLRSRSVSQTDAPRMRLRYSVTGA
ncbi:MAG: hypothetical protein V7K48_06050 [Nostoc sp.]|uniref:hypothetical protein n=1 Tax=Nostoc sp. TaxID=1180 RepID=UPI002FFAFB15